MRQPNLWLAVLLSLLVPGLGHLYCGRVGVAVLLTAANQLLRWAVAWGSIEHGALALAFIVAVTLAFQIGVAVDAARISLVLTSRFTSGWRLGVSILGFVVLAGSFALALDAVSPRAETWRNPSGSMLPTLQIGDYFVANMSAYDDDDPQPGDIVLVRVARDSSAYFPADQRPDLPIEVFVERVVGVPGDSLQFEGAALTVNFSAVTGGATGKRVLDWTGRSFIVRTESLGTRDYEVLDREGPTDAKVFLISPNRYFLAGDNRRNSHDSRNYGTVARADIIGKVGVIYWSWNVNGNMLSFFNPANWFNAEKRWDRVGLTPQ
jgi:signal peptidase I